MTPWKVVSAVLEAVSAIAGAVRAKRRKMPPRQDVEPIDPERLRAREFIRESEASRGRRND